MSRITQQLLRQRLELPLEAKIVLSQKKIREWHEYWHGDTCVSFSGGLDSTVELHLVRDLYKNTKAVFSDTGLEYPEILDFVKTIDNVDWVRPKKTFKKVIEEHGYPVASKMNAKFIEDLRRTGNDATRNLRLTGFNRKGIYCPSMKLPKKWLKMVDAPFLISPKCCDIIKKAPLFEYHKRTGLHPYVGTRVGESRNRERAYMRTGCNIYDNAHPVSKPISFWTHDDVLEYIKIHELPYAKIYDMGEDRTGCMFCMFGVHLEKSPNRFQRMQRTHPKLWNYCINKLGLREVLDFIGVPYEHQQTLFENALDEFTNKEQPCEKK